MQSCVRSSFNSAVRFGRRPLMVLLASSMLVLSGCSVHKVAGEIAGVDVEASRGSDSHKESRKSAHGGFCPPGQRKKGNCY